MSPLRGAAVALALSAWGAVHGGCATVPKESVELSATVGHDLAAVQLAHVALVKKYFDQMEADVMAFVDDEYRPYSIERNMKDFDLVKKVSDPSKAGEGLDALDVMETFVDELTTDIDDMRAKLLAPIRAQREEVLTALEDAYRRIQDGQAVVTAHLASVHKVQELQDEALEKAGLEGMRERLLAATAKRSGEIAELTRKARYAQGKADEFAKAVGEIENATKSIVK